MNKRDNIIEAALKLLVVNGIHATPMSAIAKAANTGMGTIYNYFANKELLINAIYIDIKKKEEAILSMPASNKTIKTQFEHYYLSIVTFYFKHPNYSQFMEQLSSSPIISEESKKEGYKSIEAVMQILKDGRKEGIIKDIDMEELLQFLGGTIFAHLRWLNRKGAKKVSINNQLHLVWDAIKK